MGRPRGGRRRPQHGPWAYTVGLCEGFDHPELLIADVELSHAALTLDVFAQAVHDEEEWYLSGDVIDFGGGRTIRVVAVHPTHYRGMLVNGWLRYYDDVGPPRPVLRALQLVLSDEWFCPVHGNPQRDLSRPR